MSLKYVFWLEFVINIPSFTMCLFFPTIFIDQLTGIQGGELMNEMVRWYGVILFVLTFILGKALYEKDISALKTIFTGYAIGDLMQIAVTWKLATYIGGWNFSLIFTAALSIVLCACRIAVISKESRLGF